MFGEVISRLIDALISSVYDVEEKIEKFRESDAEIANVDIDLGLVIPPISSKGIRALERKLKKELASKGYEVSGSLAKEAKKRIKAVRMIVRPQLRKDGEEIYPCVSLIVVYLFKDQSMETKFLSVCKRTKSENG